MATTVTTGVTIGAGTLGAGAGLAVAGAVGLGLLGVAALLSKGGGNDNKGYHQTGYGYHKCHRRSNLDQSKAIANAMNLIRQEDITGCGLRYMCELAGEREEELSVEELSILNLVGPVVKPGEGLLPPGGVWDYMMAKGLGQNGENCGQAYPLCALNGTLLMNTVMEFLP